MTPDELRALRLRLKLSQAKLAELLDVKPLTVIRWEKEESDKYSIPIPRAVEIAVKCLAGHKRIRGP